MSLWTDIVNAIINIFKPKPPTPPPLPPSPPSSDVQELLTLHNQERAKAQLPALALNAKLSAAAQGHANWMAANNTLSHDENGVTFDKRITAAGYHFWSAGENIAMGQPTVQAVMTAWMNSPGHRANILRAGYKDVGFGVTEANGRMWWCVDFGAQQGAAEGFQAHEPGIYLSGPLGPTDETLSIAHLT